MLVRLPQPVSLQHRTVRCASRGTLRWSTSWQPVSHCCTCGIKIPSLVAVSRPHTLINSQLVVTVKQRVSMVPLRDLTGLEDGSVCVYDVRRADTPLLAVVRTQL